jgi:hypothetical protein
MTLKAYFDCSAEGGLDRTRVDVEEAVVVTLGRVVVMVPMGWL